MGLLWGGADTVLIVAGFLSNVFGPGDVIILQHRTGDQAHQSDLIRVLVVDDLI